VPNPPDCCEREHTVIQKSLPFSKFQQSDTECLTLNITVPGEASPHGQVPVLIFVYGGGFANGSANYPHYDMALITEMSVKAGMPIVSVGVK
jgi:carboxylesterase type B